MAKFRCLIVLGIHVLSLFVSAAAQQGFLNINCGATVNETDSRTNMTWIEDSKYVNGGEMANVGSPAIASYLQSFRYFPKPLNKSCYQLPVNRNVPYLLRLWFVSGNFNGIFNVSVETKGMLQMESFTGVENSNWTTEKILAGSGNSLSVCLIRTLEDSNPFISAIQLRSLSSGMYALQDKPGKMLSSVSRYDIGSTSNSSLIRYPLDEFDRFWQSDSSSNFNSTGFFENRTSDKRVSSGNSSGNFPPNAVIQTAIIAKTEAAKLSLNLREPKTSTLVALYFGEIEALNASDSRIFTVSINGKYIATINFSTESYTIEHRMSLNDSDQARELVVSLDAVENRANSSRGPLINALEQYNILNTEPETDAGDVSSLLNFKSTFGMENWISDPCFGIEWDGIRCDKGKPVRVLEIDLSGRGKIGEMPMLCNLTGLEILRLQNNDLSGEIPECLTTFPKLKELNLDNNNFSGIIPQGLLNNSRLSLRIKGNPLLCQSNRNLCHPKGKNVVAIVGYSVGAILGVLISLLSIIIYRRRYSNKRSKANRSLQENTSLLSVAIPNPLRPRQFSLEEMKEATENFSKQIGQGGFGSVYFGCLQNRREVAVKVLSASSKQGVPEFLNEIDLLSRVNHKNLVSLLGYCKVSNQLMLVYEYMGGGSLKDHLYGSMANTSPLDWKSRLKIALDAAEGLEYLHVKSTQKIIHRDVKSCNILLDRSMRAKVADFGLSKILGDETVSHVSTNVKGTVGYLDPEYCRTYKLTERSDVFSFGVVLLEIICGRKPVEEALPEEEIHIVEWVMLHAEATEDSPRQLTDIMDQNLSMSEDEMKSFDILLNLSIECIQNEGSKRPTMSEIVAGIRNAMSVICPDEEPTESLAKPLCSAEISTSILHVGR